MAGVKKLSEYTTGRENNFNLIRFVAALMVMLSHAYPISSGAGAREPLARAFGLSFGGMAVWAFFVISGFLITASWMRKESLWRYLVARVARIYPGLIVSVLFCIVVVGWSFTELPTGEYFGHWITSKFLWNNSSLVNIIYPLPEVFRQNVYPDVTNGSLWTLPYEVGLYLFVALAGLVGVFRSRTRIALSLGGVILLFALLPEAWTPAVEFLSGTPYLWKQVGVLSTYFILGSLAWVFRDLIPVGKMLLAGSLVGCGLLGASGFHSYLFPVVFTYSIFGLAYVPGGRIREFNRLGDYSYGIYIYAFPVQQAVEALFPESGVAFNFWVSLPVVLLLGVASWVAVERPALALAKKWVK